MSAGRHLDDAIREADRLEAENAKLREALESIRSEIDGKADVDDNPDRNMGQPNVFMRIDTLIDAVLDGSR